MQPTHPHPTSPVAYFSMEIGFDARYPTYSGGLGVLSGDTIKAAADLRVPLVAVSLLHEHGFFKQVLDTNGTQREEPEEWKPAEAFVAVDARVHVAIEGRRVAVRTWRADIKGVYGYVVPVYFLDTNLPENSDADRLLTSRLYGGDSDYRLKQELILGVGGVRMLEALGITPCKFHMNEGHSAFLVLELLAQTRAATASYDSDYVRSRCVFTTHTPVAAGHDVFTREQLTRAWADAPLDAPNVLTEHGAVDMTHLALSHAEYVNGVAKKHGEVSRQLFPGYCIDSITNGIHTGTWVGPDMQATFDKHVPGWKADYSMLRYALGISSAEVREAHTAAKKRLFMHINMTTGVTLDPNVFTIGFARRATAYKRADLLLRDLPRLRALGERSGGLQIVYAGKAHPKDTEGKHIIERIVAASKELGPHVTLLYLPNYGMSLAGLLVSGVDVWLNTPLPPYEASGTSGMKAAANGVPSLSVLDGWWIEGCLEGITGWSFGAPPGSELRAAEERDAADARALMEKLEQTILPLYRENPEGWALVMRNAIAINGSFFNTHRMVQEYVLRAYFQ